MTQSGGPFYQNPNKKRDPQQENDPRSDQLHHNWPQNPGSPETSGAYDAASWNYRDRQGQFGDRPQFANTPVPGDRQYGEYKSGYLPQSHEQQFYPATPQQQGAHGMDYQPYRQSNGYDTSTDYNAVQAEGQTWSQTGPSFGAGGYESSYPQHSQPSQASVHGHHAWPAREPNAGDFPSHYDRSAFADNNYNYDLANYKPQMQGNQPEFGNAGYTPTENWHRGSHAAAGHPGFGAAAGEINSDGTAYRNDAYRDDINDDYEDDEEEESGSRRGIIIAAVLISTIVIGAGFVYGYNTLFSKRSEKQLTPIVNASKNPTRVRPDDPGGQKFENSDSELMNRIGNRGEADQLGETDANGNRVRTVSTLVVGRDGRLIVENENKAQSDSQEGQSKSPASQSGDIAAAGIPGMIIEGEGGAPHAAPPNEPQAATTNEMPQDAASQQHASVPPVTVPQIETPQARTEEIETPQDRQPDAQSQSPAAQEQARPAIAPRRNSKFPPLPQLSGLNKPNVDLGPETPAPANSEDDELAAGPQQLGVDRAAAGPAPNGYVAVLSTKRSRIDALTSFADLQQRYPNILSAKVPDVRRADLTTEGLGVMYRAVVGPPGSREIASQLCDRLKTVGYQNCWVSAY